MTCGKIRRPRHAGRCDRGRCSVCADEAHPDTTLARLQRAATRRLRPQRNVERIYALGPRVVSELLDELDRHHRLGSGLDQRLARYAELDPLILAAIGGDRFAHEPVHVVASGR